MNVRCKPDRLITQIRHLPRIFERTFERTANFGLVGLRLGEFLPGVVERPPDLALVGSLQLFEDPSQFGEFGADVGGVGSWWRLPFKFAVEFRVDRVAASCDDDAAG